MKAQAAKRDSRVTRIREWVSKGKAHSLPILLSAAMVVMAAGCPEGPALYSAKGEGVADNPIGASAMFYVEDDVLHLLLENDAIADVTRPAELLVAVFFDLPDDVFLVPMDVTVPEGSSVVFAPTVDADGNAITGGTYEGGDVSAEWGYNDELKNAPLGARHGVSSWGMGGLFGNQTRFDTGRNLQGSRSPNGMQYAITSLGDDPTTGNAAVTGRPEDSEYGGTGDHHAKDDDGCGGSSEEEGRALIQHAVLVRFGIIGENFEANQIDKVSFQYLGLANLNGQRRLGNNDPSPGNGRN